MATRRIKIEVDDAQALASVARINARINGIGTANPTGVNNLSNALNGIGASNPAISRVITSLNGVGSSGSAAGQALQAANNNSIGLAGGLGNVSTAAGTAAGNLTLVNSALGAIGFLAATAGVVALTGAIIAGTKESITFKNKLAEVSTLVDETKFNLDALTKGILDQAAAYGALPVDQAAAAYQIISAGATSAASAITTLDVANKLAVGGVTDVFTAADGLTSVVNAYGPAVLSARDASDAMFVAMKDGKTTIGELSANLGKVAPLAAQAGVSFDELLAATAALTKGGINTSETISGLRAIFAAVAKPASEAGKVADQLGIQFNAAGLKSQGLAQFLTNLKEKTGGNVDTLAKLFGGVEALVPVLALAGQAGVDFTATLEDMKNKGGATEAAYDKLAASPGFQLSRVMAAMKVEAISLGNAFASAVAPAAKFVADNLHGAVVAAKALAAAFIVYKSISFASTILSSATALGTLSKIAGGLNVVIRGLTAAQALFNAVLLANPLTALAAAAAGAIVLLYEFRDSISLGGDSVASLGDLFRATWEVMGEAIGPVITSIREGFTVAYAAVSAFVTGALDAGAKFAGPFFIALDFLNRAFKSTFGDLDFSISGILIGAARTIDLLIGLFSGGLNVIVALWKGLPAALGPNFQAILAGAKSVVVAIGTGIGAAFNAVKGYASSVASIVAAVFNSISSFIEKWVNKGIAGINILIAGANKLGGSIAPLGEIKLGRVEAPKANPSGFTKLGQDLGAAFKAGFSNQAEQGVRGLLARANNIGKARLGAGAAASPSPLVQKSGPALSLADGADGAAKAKDSAAKKLADRNKLEQEYWQTLKDQAAVAALLPLAADQYNKELELRKILGDGEVKNSIQLSELQKSRIAQALADKAQNEVLRDIALQTRDAGIEKLRLDEQGSIFAKSTADNAAINLAVEEKIWPLKEKQLKAGLSLQDQAFQAQLATLEARERENALIAQRNKLLADTQSATVTYAREAITTDGSPQDKKSRLKDEFDAQIQNLNQTIGQLTPNEFRAGVARATREFKEGIARSGNDFAQNFSGILNKFGTAIGGVVGDVINSAGGVVSAFGSFGTTQGDVSKDIAALFGAKGGATTAISDAVGGAFAGLEIGQSIGSLAKAVGIKGAGTGAALGGAIGGLAFGPLGAIGGAIIGGLIGALTYRAPSATTTLTGLAPATVTGNKAVARDSVSLTASSVQKGLSSIASALDGAVGSFSVSIGKREDYFRVIAEGGRNAGAKYPGREGTVLYDGKDEAKAIAIAIENAIADGAITGISATVQNALKILGTEAAVSFYKSWTSALDDYESIINPAASAIKAITKPLDQLRKTMVEVGATTEELTKIDAYRALKIDQVLKDQVSSLNSFKDSLYGEGSGVTALNRLNADLEKFNVFKTKIAAGETIDQSEFTNLGQRILSGASNVYGTSTSLFQDIRAALIAATNGAISNVTTAVNDASVVAIDRNTDAVTSAINSLPERIAAAIATTGNGGGGGGGYSAGRALQY